MLLCMFHLWLQHSWDTRVRATNKFLYLHSSFYSWIQREIHRECESSFMKYVFHQSQLKCDFLLSKLKFSIFESVLHNVLRRLPLHKFLHDYSRKLKLCSLQCLFCLNYSAVVSFFSTSAALVCTTRFHKDASTTV